MHVAPQTRVFVAHHVPSRRRLDAAERQHWPNWPFVLVGPFLRDVMRSVRAPSGVVQHPRLFGVVAAAAWGSNRGSHRIIRGCRPFRRDRRSGGIGHLRLPGAG